MENWRNQAACKGMDPSLFLPHGSRGATFANLEQLQEICGSCPVQSECLSDALKRPDESFRAGYTPKELKVARRQISIESDMPMTGDHGTNAGYAHHRYRNEDPCASCKQAHSVYVSERYRKNHVPGRMGAPLRPDAKYGFANR